ncbi:hypothetical protein BC941DRAFT_415386 [Chlamydoabsidia padenii]|nr:hypothetical protein BC941DRAFT_415386 [Chlamydoabsidia padenii]
MTMSSSDRSKLAHNPFLLVTTILAVCALLVSLTGACALKVLQGAWWVVIYQVILVAGHAVIFMRGVLAHYRLAMLTLLAISIPLLTIQIDYIIQYSKPAQLNRIAANAYAAGYIGLVIIQYIWVLVLGSEPTSYLGQWAQDNQSLQSTSLPHFYSEKQNHHQAGFSQVLIPHVIPNNQQTPSGTEFKEKVQAIHSYQANPKDPNELDFVKGEVVDIVNRKGNWWQARKANGQIGIIPSNYFQSLKE